MLMVIKALCDHYDYLEREGKITEPGFSITPVYYMIMLSLTGQIADIIDVQMEKIIPNPKNPNNPKTEWQPRKEKMPLREKITNINSYRLDHRSKYIFGLSLDEKEESFLSPSVSNNSSLKKAHEKFCERNLEFISGIDSPVVNAFRNFLLTWDSEKERENPILSRFLKKKEENEEEEIEKNEKKKKKKGKRAFSNFDDASFCFALDGHPEIKLHEDPFILEKVRKKEENEDENESVCSVTGKKGKIAELHRSVKGIGGQMAGTMVCVNDSAGESYGLKNAFTSGISEEAMMKYTEAFNILTGSKDEITDNYTNKIVIDDVTIVFFANDKTASSVDPLIRCLMFANDSEDARKTEEILKTIMRSAKSGIACDWKNVNIDPDTNYYIMGVTPNMGRVSLKFFHRNNVGNLLINVAMHQNDIAINNSSRTISVRDIAKELVSPKSKEEKVSPSLMSNLFGSVFLGERYPTELLATIVRRIKTDSDDAKNKNFYIKINDARVGIIKAYINRNNRMAGKKEEITVSLDKTNTNKAYVCGRLFAILERIQQDAIKDLNCGIRDKFFGSAASRPASILPRLITLSQNHLHKIDENKRVMYQAMIANIMDLIESDFPATFSLEDQGRFFIGYYHQKMYRKEKENNQQDSKTETKEENN